MGKKSVFLNDILFTLKYYESQQGLGMSTGLQICVTKPAHWPIKTSLNSKTPNMSLYNP